MSKSGPLLEEVRRFWNTEARDMGEVKDSSNEANFTKKFREHRFRTQWHVPLLVPFTEAKSKKVLEIGIG
jgi:hypothetical protein